jgi:hypothetical protein
MHVECIYTAYKVNSGSSIIKYGHYTTIYE